MSFLKSAFNVLFGSPEFHRKNNIRLEEIRRKNDNGSFLGGVVQGIIESGQDRTRVGYYDEESDEDRQRHKDENQAKIDYERGNRK